MSPGGEEVAALKRANADLSESSQQLEARVRELTAAAAEAEEKLKEAQGNLASAHQQKAADIEMLEKKQHELVLANRQGGRDGTSWAV